MFTTKQRSKLRSIAQTIEPVGQIGKGGITENVVNTFSEALDKRELIKISVLNNTEDDAESLSIELAEKLGAEFVCATGRKLVFYRRSKNPKVEHIIF